MAHRIQLQGSLNEPMRFSFVHPITMSDTFAILNDSIEWVVRMVIREEWIATNPVASPNIIASKFASNFMDFSQSRELTKLVVGEYVHSFAFTLEEVNLQLDNYDLFRGDIWWGGFLNRDFF